MGYLTKLKTAMPLVLLPLLLGGCGYSIRDLTEFTLSQRQIEETSPFVEVPANRAWVNASAAQRGIVMQRGLRNGSEQRLNLPNDSYVSGDNIMVLRTRSGSHAAARFRFEEFLSRIGGLPAPFADLTSGSLMASSDQMGDYLWASKPYGNDIICVLGMRRITSAMRNLPGDADVMDIMLRNCVRGEAEAALGPIRAENIGIGAGAARREVGTRLLSPLAGPLSP